MKNKLIMLLSVLALSCSNDDTTDKTDIALVTGVTFRETSDSQSLTLGNPNNMTANKFVLYPNPIKEVVYVAADTQITDIWVVRATAENIHQDFDFSTLFSPNFYDEQVIASNAAFSLSEQTASQLSLNLNQLEDGYYRIFVKIDGKTYWDNFYKNDDITEDTIDELINFWK